MLETDLYQLFKLNVPIKDGEWWNGKPEHWSNLQKYRLEYSQRFGMSLLDYSPMKGHNGLDIAGAELTPIVFPIKLYTTYIGFNNEIKGADPNGYGNFVFAETEPVEFKGEIVKLEMVFAHFKRIDCQPYKWYPAGELMGGMGTTGRSTGNHVHNGGRPLIKIDGGFKQLFPDNGFRGYIDIEPMITQHLIWDYRELTQDFNIRNYMATNEKKIIIEGEGKGRKGVIVNGKLREIKDGREADACLYVLANNGMGQTINTDLFNKLPRDINF